MRFLKRRRFHESCRKSCFEVPGFGNVQSLRRCYSTGLSRTYDDAVGMLNTLQTPYKVLRERRDAGVKPDERAKEEMRKNLTRIGYSQNDLKRLNIIHVAGTKGKGSTCAYVDSILSQYRTSHDRSYKIGLFTSPHLIAVRERIRLDSIPISPSLFAKYFFEVWDLLSSTQSTSHTMCDKPGYFRFLNLMSYHVFIQEKVDVVISEVGIGGEFDSTNIVDAPAVTGITALDIDHTFALGETIEQIAWHKGGIQKKGVPSFTVSQVPAAMDVLRNRAEERSVESFQVVEVDPRLKSVKVRPDAQFQKSNASLAVALAETALKKLDPKFQAPAKSLPTEFVHGLEQVVWRGRCETKVEGNVTWYLDGAHTADSITVAAKWFGDESSRKSGSKILVFNQQGHREAVELLKGLFNAINSQGEVQFDHVIFCPTTPAEAGRKDHVNLSTDPGAIASLTVQNEFAAIWRVLDKTPETSVQVLPSVEDALAYVQNMGNEGKKVHALVTGSVHLVGRVLGVLEGVSAV